jgi:hypothetical protein
MVPLYNMVFPVAVHKLQLLGMTADKLTRSQIIRDMLSNSVGEIDENQIRKEDVDKLLNL